MLLIFRRCRKKFFTNCLNNTIDFQCKFSFSLQNFVKNYIRREKNKLNELLESKTNKIVNGG